MFTHQTHRFGRLGWNVQERRRHASKSPGACMHACTCAYGRHSLDAPMHGAEPCTVLYLYVGVVNVATVVPFGQAEARVTNRRLSPPAISPASPYSKESIEDARSKRHSRVPAPHRHCPPPSSRRAPSLRPCRLHHGSQMGTRRE
jgi:hypothetical protein